MMELHQRYAKKSDGRELFAFNNAFVRYIRHKKETLLDLTVVAANLGMRIPENASEIDPLALRAMMVTNPSFQPELVSTYSPDQMMGIVNSAKGKYFEYLVADRLNAGERVGDIILPDGYTAQLAESMYQPGWDLSIAGPDGNITEYIQLKATNSLNYIEDTLDRYPDIAILTTDEIADKAHGLVLDSNITEDSVRSGIMSLFEDESLPTSECFDEAFAPILPLVFIAATEGLYVWMGKKSIITALKGGGWRSCRSILSSGIGAMIVAMGGGWLGIPASIATGICFSRVLEQTRTMRNLDRIMERLVEFRNYQQLKIGTGAGGY